ncbi:hypothetical protein NDU88_006231 [Pleurodeles waltl]|uniref:Uncharacterized protein n=1 Tax=Pleurodeles waltl TaxID=8319 RepID=A0AAV7TXR3_PLEWA|nr:hypothetical protein NDU88_006231 [Pleurodeles waltl]
MQSSSNISEEEETISVFPWDDEFYKAVDASIHKAVAEAIALIEQHLFRQVLDEDLRSQMPLVPQPLHAKHKFLGADQDAFAHLKKVFLAKTRTFLESMGSCDEMAPPHYSSPDMMGLEDSHGDSEE